MTKSFGLADEPQLACHLYLVIQVTENERACTEKMFGELRMNAARSGDSYE